MILFLFLISGGVALLTWILSGYFIAGLIVGGVIFVGGIKFALIGDFVITALEYREACEDLRTDKLTEAIGKKSGSKHLHLHVHKHGRENGERKLSKERE